MDVVEQWYMVVGHCLWSEKVKSVEEISSEHSMQWTQWMQYSVDTVDAVCSGCSRHSEIVVYGSQDIVFGTKRSNQWTQCNSGGDIVFDAKKSNQWMWWT